MKKDIGKEERAARDRQRASNSAADWIKVMFANGSTRMVRRADYERGR